jgi:hypothetical protein
MGSLPLAVPWMSAVNTAKIKAKAVAQKSRQLCQVGGRKDFRVVGRVIPMPWVDGTGWAAV